MHSFLKEALMKQTNPGNLEARFDAGDAILDAFETGVILNIGRLADLSGIMNISALAREAGIPVQTLQAKIRRRSPLTGEETKALVRALKRHHLATV